MMTHVSVTVSAEWFCWPDSWIPGRPAKQAFRFQQANIPCAHNPLATSTDEQRLTISRRPTPRAVRGTVKTTV
jgi:hypothetical protein